MQVFDGPVAITCNGHSAGEDPVRILVRGRPDTIHSLTQIELSPVIEIRRSQDHEQIESPDGLEALYPRHRQILIKSLSVASLQNAKKFCFES
jgi:hypothetical protein